MSNLEDVLTSFPTANYIFSILLYDASSSSRNSRSSWAVYTIAEAEKINEEVSSERIKDKRVNYLGTQVKFVHCANLGVRVKFIQSTTKYFYKVTLLSVISLYPKSGAMYIGLPVACFYVT